MRFMLVRTAVSITALAGIAGCATSVKSSAAPATTDIVITQKSGPANLVLTFNTDSADGAVMVAIFNSAESYNAGKPIKGVRVPMSSTSQTERLENLAAGSYAIRAFHDVNEDGVLNTNPFGAPVEPFAFSRGAKPRFGPPNWDDASIELVPGENAETLNFQQ
ncbi:MAG: DUF2141 domain-containing protein [Pseudomonadota bacterium]